MEIFRLAGVNVAGRGRITLPERQLGPATALPGNQAFRRDCNLPPAAGFRTSAEPDGGSIASRPPDGNRVLPARNPGRRLRGRAEGLTYDIRLEGACLPPSCKWRKRAYGISRRNIVPPRAEIDDRELRVQKLEAFAAPALARSSHLERHDRRNDAFCRTRADEAWCNPGVILPVLNCCAAGLTQVVDNINDFSFGRTPPLYQHNADFSGRLLQWPRVFLNGVIQANYLVYEDVPVELAQSAYSPPEFPPAERAGLRAPQPATRREGPCRGGWRWISTPAWSSLMRFLPVDVQAAAG